MVTPGRRSNHLVLILDPLLEAASSSESELDAEAFSSSLW